ncbi:MAG: hypothetical protein V1706_09565 [Pseudomonadota bacterium]
MKNKGVAILVCLCALVFSRGGTCLAMDQVENGKAETSAENPVEEPAMAAIPPAGKDQAVSDSEPAPIVIPPSEPEMAAIPGE